MLLLPLFFYGFLAACAGLLLQVALLVLLNNENLLFTPGLVFLMTNALLEELAKFIFLIQASRRYQEALRFSSLICFGVGFAAVEIGLAWYTPGGFLWPPLLLNAGFHLVTIVFLGILLRSYSLRQPLLWVGFIGVSFLHGLYNFFRLAA